MPHDVAVALVGTDELKRRAVRYLEVAELFSTVRFADDALAVLAAMNPVVVAGSASACNVSTGSGQFVWLATRDGLEHTLERNSEARRLLAGLDTGLRERFGDGLFTESVIRQCRYGRFVVPDASRAVELADLQAVGIRLVRLTVAGSSPVEIPDWEGEYDYDLTIETDARNEPQFEPLRLAVRKFTAPTPPQWRAPNQHAVYVGG